MNYRIVWDPDAVETLQRLYDASSDREGIAHAVTRIGLELSANPGQAGESREPGTRIVFKPPLLVWFHINERMKTVVIQDVRPSRR